MELIKTQSFELAILTRGNVTSDKLAICLPGRLDTKDYACFTSHIKFLAEKGFLAVTLDPPGTWDSPGGTELFTTTNYIKVVNELIEQFGNKATLLMGHSRGGQVASLVATANPAVEGLILVNASYGAPTPPEPDEVVDGKVISFRDLPPGIEKTKEQVRFELPMDYFTDAQQYDPLPSLKSYKKPKLIFYGIDDEYEPKEIKEIYNSLSDPKEIHELETDHDYRYHSSVIEEVNRIMGQFIDKYF